MGLVFVGDGRVDVVLEVAALFQEPDHAISEDGDHSLNLVVSRRIDPPVLGTPVELLGCRVVTPLEKQHVVVDVEVEAATEPLDEGDGPRLEFGAEALLFGFLADVGRDGTMDDGQATRLDLRVFRQNETNRHGETEHPLTDADLGEDGVDQVGGAFCHAPAAAGRAESALLTRKGDELFGFAVPAPEPGVLGHSAHLTL